MATWLPLVTRIRNIAEHACTSTGEDPFSHARTTLANPVERLIDRALLGQLLTPEHHLFMYSAVLPPLPEAHRLLLEKGLIQRMEVRPRISRRDAAGDLTRAGVTLLRRHQG